MFFKAKNHQLVINQKQYEIEVLAKETLLQAALREGIEFPHRCRVGACATCKCQLTKGEVKELTDKAYVLSEQELEQGYILACQSLARTHVAIEVAFPAKEPS